MNWARLYFGSLIVVLGVLLLLDGADVLDAGEVISTWWPVALIGAGGLALIANPRHWPVPVVIIVGGTAILLRTTDVVDSLSLIIPALVIVVGLFVIFGLGFGRSASDTGDRVSSFSMFSGTEIASHSTSFEGGNVGAIFGGTEIDLRDAVPSEDASLDVFVAFGGVEVRVPEGWRVDMNGLPLFGGFENVTTKETLSGDAPSLDVHGTALFGGIEIKH
jgi:hypothetical protein